MALRRNLPSLLAQLRQHLLMRTPMSIKLAGAGGPMPLNMPIPDPHLVGPSRQPGSLQIAWRGMIMDRCGDCYLIAE